MMIRNGILALLAGVGLSAGTSPAPTIDPARRTYKVDWTIQVDSIPAGAREAKVWVALPQSLPEQSVSGFKVKGNYKHRVVNDPDFQNRVMVVVIPEPKAPFSIDLSAAVERRSVDGPRTAALTPKGRELYLRKEALVSLSNRIRALADSIGSSNRARYDYVLEKMTYDKVVPGWGQGDSERACEVGKGNCTDFHSLFMSLSRAKGIPTRFEMGYSTLPDGETKKAGGYHCWAWFYDDAAKAWVPVDISEADKHPEKAEYFFGHLDADRITFSVGRDVKLPGMKGKPLNYLPSGAYVEVDGTPLSTGVTRTISYTVDGGKAAG